MDVSIIIVNYNTKNLLIDCINSVKEKTQDISYEIIVVDNASTDGSIESLKKNHPDVIVIASNENLGFGRANNLGAKYSKGKYLFLLNTDTLLINNSIKIFFDEMEKDTSEEISVCGGNLFHLDGSQNYSYSMYYPSLKSIFCYRMYLTKLLDNECFNNTPMNKDVAFVIGADLFIRSNIFKSLSGFDENFFMYVEETELQYRIKQLGKRIISVPSAKIIHMQGASSSTFFKLRTEYDSYLYYFKKHFGLSTAKKYRLIDLYTSKFKYYITKILRNNKSENFRLISNYIKLSKIS